MQWCTISIQRLREYDARKKALINIPEQIKSLELQATALKAVTLDSDRVQTSGNNAQDALIGNIARREELANNLEIAKRECAITERGLEALTDQERRVLQVFFVSRPKNHVSRLCDELFCEKSRLYQVKDDALRRFTIASYGIVDL